MRTKDKILQKYGKTGERAEALTGKLFDAILKVLKDRKELTPQKGIDYFTLKEQEEWKLEIKEDVFRNLEKDLSNFEKNFRLSLKNVQSNLQSFKSEFEDFSIVASKKIEKLSKSTQNNLENIKDNKQSIKGLKEDFDSKLKELEIRFSKGVTEILNDVAKERKKKIKISDIENFKKEVAKIAKQIVLGFPFGGGGGGSGGGIPDVTDSNTYLRSQGSWVASDVFTSADYYTKTDVDTLLNEKVDVTDFNNHVNDTSIHFTMLDEDDFASNSDTQAATQQSIKAYVDNSIGALDIRTDHNALDNLQGGTTGEYYHFTNAEHTAILDLINNPIDADKVDGYDVVGLDLNEVAYYDGVNITGSANLTFDGTTFSAYETFIGSGGIFSNQNHRGIDKIVSVQKDSSTVITLTFEDGILVDYAETTI